MPTLPPGRPRGAGAQARARPQPLPRPGLAGGSAEMRGSDAPEKPEPA